MTGRCNADNHCVGKRCKWLWYLYKNAIYVCACESVYLYACLKPTSKQCDKYTKWELVLLPFYHFTKEFRVLYSGWAFICTHLDKIWWQKHKHLSVNFRSRLEWKTLYDCLLLLLLPPKLLQTVCLFFALLLCFALQLYQYCPFSAHQFFFLYLFFLVR